jgi:Lectin C-type domain
LKSCMIRKLELISLSEKTKFKNCISNLDQLEVNMQYKHADENAMKGFYLLIQIEILKVPLTKKSKADFWTSGVKLSKNESTWAWCSENGDVSPQLKKVKPPKSPLCVKVNGSGVLESIDCSTKLRFICEVKYDTKLYNFNINVSKIQWFSPIVPLQTTVVFIFRCLQQKCKLDSV